MVPRYTQSWFDVIATLADLAIKNARSELVTEDVATSAAALLAETRAATSELMIARLSERLGLSPEEVIAAWCLVGSQLSGKVSPRLETLSGDVDITLGAIAAIAYPYAYGRAIIELAPTGRLARFGLIEISENPRLGWSRRTVRATDRLLCLALTSDSSIDPAVAAFVREDAEALSLDQLAVAEQAISRAKEGIAASMMVIASGLPGLGRRSLLAAVARDEGLSIVDVDVRRLSRELPVLKSQLRHLVRECRLLARVPLLANLDALPTEALPIVDDELAMQLEGAVLATVGPQRPPHRWRRPTAVIDLVQPTWKQRAAVWKAALGRGTASDAEHLASVYPLAPSMIHHAARSANATAIDRPLVPDDIRAGIRAVLDDRLGVNARRVSISQTWDDLVLPPEQIDSIVELLARVRGRRRVHEDWGFGAKVGKGLGITALFTGPPGTGKTMVASLIARDLGLELYQVDLGKLVSKWIGETEKQLGELLDAAEAGHAILLFDEADSLFGKRTEVKSSNDRYANLETNYLLQRLETFTGICLLTSNHDSNIDPAFHRRLSVQIRFEVPDAEERARLWRAMLPADAPTADDLNLPGLAVRYEMTGGYIRNAALRAAFLAADEDSVITGAHLERAARVEYEALGKIAA